MHTGDDGHGQALDPVEDAVPEVHEDAPAIGIGRELLHHPQIRPRAEGAAGAGQRDRAHGGVGLDRRARRVEVVEQLRADRVELGGTVEDDARDRAIALEANGGHEPSMSRWSGETMVRPPSSRMVCPVRKAAASLTR